MDATYAFGRFELSTAARELRAGGAPVALGARAFDVLAALVERRDRLVPKNELLALVWPNVVVEENNLQVQISALRKLLGPQAIATIPGRGYRFTALLSGAAPATTLPQPTSAPARASAAACTNLPEQLPPLYGRADDLAMLRELVAAHALVTLVGPGGIGKTCLAQAAAQTFREAFADGVWVVELAPVTDATRVQGTVSRLLELRSEPSRAADLAAMLASRRMLLVLDNCEHLLDAVAQLAAELQRQAPHVRVLATSQEPLKLADEQVYRLGTLAVPDTPSLAGAEEAGAIALFVARARSADPRFALTDANVATVIEICRRLDGIPLAIELAAARVPLLGVDGLCARLSDRFRVLTAGARLALRRHQTLRAALEWSYGLLTGDEQAAFRRLGVFAGSFGLESAQHVIAAGGIDAWAALDLLGTLVDKSLVVADAGAEPRYRLLETGRAFALEQLANAGETAEAVRRHAEATLAVFERSWSERWTAVTQRALARYGPELDNLRAALDWSAGPDGDPDLHIALAGASAWLWKFAALQQEGLARFQAAAARVQPETPLAIEARFRLGHAMFGHNQSVAADAAAAATRRAIECFRALDDREGLYCALAFRSRHHSAVGDLAAAEGDLAEATALLDPAWPPGLRTLLLAARAFILIGRGQLAEAGAMWEEQLRIEQSLGDARLAVVSLNNLVDNVLARGDVAEAIRRGRELVAMVRRERFVGYESFALGNLGAALTAAGELDEALVVAREAVPLLRQQGALAAFLIHFAMLAARRGRIADAARALGCEERAVRAQGYQRQYYEERVHTELAKLLRERLPQGELQRLLAEGAALSADEGASLALSV